MAAPPADERKCVCQCKTLMPGWIKERLAGRTLMSPSVSVISHVHMFQAHDSEKCSPAWFNHMHRRNVPPAWRQASCMLPADRQECV